MVFLIVVNLFLIVAAFLIVATFFSCCEFFDCCASYLFCFDFFFLFFTLRVILKRNEYIVTKVVNPKIKTFFACKSTFFY